MPVKPKDFAQAASENVKDEFAYGSWFVYDDNDYKLVRIDGNDAYIKVPLVPGKPLGKPREYNPLQARGLFLEFAEIAEGGEITHDDWLDWTRRWGVLGIDWREWPVDMHRGGPRERFSVFKGEAQIVNWVLRLYEAATAADGPDVQRIGQLLELDDDDTDGSAEEMKGLALYEAKTMVQRRLIGECFPRLYLQSDLTIVHSPSGFGSLVGAMYLQMMWLITATGKIKRCAGPECDRIIYFDTSELPDDPEARGRAVRGVYKSRKYCSDNCRVKRWQRNKKKEDER